MSALPEDSVSVCEAQPSAVSELVTLSVGEELRAAREAAGQTSADVAKTLKLSARQIEALENGDWSVLPGPTFVRGFVRNYARLFRLDADRLVSALEGSHLPQAPKLDLPSTTCESLPERNAPHRRDFAAVLSGVVMIALAVAAYFFLPQNFWQTTQADFSVARQAVERLFARPVAEPVSEPPVAQRSSSAAEVQVVTQKIKEAPEAAPKLAAATATTATTVVTVAAAAPNTAPATLPPTPVSMASAAAVATAAPLPLKTPDVAAPALLGESGVHLSFSRPSWVEIRDRKGMIIFSQLNPADSQRYIEGELPLSLVIGNARHVSLKFRGKSIDLAQRSKDDVARLTLE